MTVTNEDNKGNICKWNEETKQWTYSDGDVCIDGKKKKICPKCNKPRVDLNGVEDVDFCLQGLTDCSFITNACCGHNHPEDAYISLADGRRFVLDKEYNGDSVLTENKRYIVDDAGTLIDMKTRECFDMVEEVVDLLNTQEEEIQRLKKFIKRWIWND